MALHVKREDLKHVPWFSLAEWQEVYKQIYSNETSEQTKGYERLLVWKARLPKLPVGVECTLSIIQVCLRDREITPKIDAGELPSYYEDDLCLMYSTTIMRFLNHITHIGETKQSSLFRIADQLKIPRWIVNIRHDAAHGHELPSISVLRIATNMLFEWLHEEYWAAETKAIEDDIAKEVEEDNEPEEVQTLIDLIELWVSVGLYIHAGYDSIKEIPDAQLRETLSDLRAYAMNLRTDENSEECDETNIGKKNKNSSDLSSNENYKLVTGKSILLSEISRYLSKNKYPSNKEEIVLNVLLEGDAFLPSQEFLEIFKKKTSSRLDDKTHDCLPLSLIYFWQDFITLLHDKDILQKLILRLLKLSNNEEENDHKRLVASLWIKYIACSLYKIKLAQKIKHRMEQAQENKRKKTSSAILSLKVRDEVDRNYPGLRDILWFNVLGEIPSLLTDLNFVRNIVSNLNNKFSNHFVAPLLELITPGLDDDVKKNLLKFIRVYTNEEIIDDKSEPLDEVKTIRDFTALFDIQNSENIILNRRFDQASTENTTELADKTIRNQSWELETAETFDWGNCPFGILPWQLESMDTVETCSARTVNYSTLSDEPNVLPGVVDDKGLTTKRKVNWNSVLGRRKPKRKRNRSTHNNIVDKAIQIVKKCY